MRKIIYTLHLWIGLASGLLVFIVATTGAVQAFEEDLRNWLQHKHLFVARNPSTATHTATHTAALVKPSVVCATMQRDASHEVIEQIRFRYAASPVQPDSTNAEIPTFLVMTESDNIYSVHPQTGQILGVRNMTTDALSIALELHTSLLLGRFGDAWYDVGEEIIKWNTLIFFVMLISGIILWMPMNMRLLKNAMRNSFRVRWNASASNAGIKRNYDLHRVAGFYAFGVMLIVAWTAIFWMFDAVEEGIYAFFGKKQTYLEKPKSFKPKENQDSVAVLSVPDRAMQEITRFGEPYFVSLQLPKKKTDALRLVVRYPYRFLRKQSVFYFDQYSARLMKSDLHENYTTPDNVRVSNYDLHTGKMFGWAGKTLWLLAALFTASLPVTGFLLWWKKRTALR